MDSVLSVTLCSLYANGNGVAIQRAQSHIYEAARGVNGFLRYLSWAARLAA